MEEYQMSKLNCEDDARDLSITLTDKILNNFENYISKKDRKFYRGVKNIEKENQSRARALLLHLSRSRQSRQAIVHVRLCSYCVLQGQFYTQKW